MALLARQSGIAQKAVSPAPVKAAPAPRAVRCKSYVPLELIAAGMCFCAAGTSSCMAPTPQSRLFCSLRTKAWLSKLAAAYASCTFGS